MKDIHRVLKTIQVNSEKAQILTENNVYVFKVDKRATKIEIKEAVKRVLGKDVVSVKTANYQGKKKEEGRVQCWDVERIGKRLTSN